MREKKRGGSPWDGTAIQRQWTLCEAQQGLWTCSCSSANEWKHMVMSPPSGTWQNCRRRDTLLQCIRQNSRMYYSSSKERVKESWKQAWNNLLSCSFPCAVPWPLKAIMEIRKELVRLSDAEKWLHEMKSCEKNKKMQMADREDTNADTLLEMRAFGVVKESDQRCWLDRGIAQHCTVSRHFMRSFIWYEFNK